MAIIIIAIGIGRWGSLIKVREESQVTVGVGITVAEGHLVAIYSKALNSVTCSDASWQEAKVEVVVAQRVIVDRGCIPIIVIQANK